MFTDLSMRQCADNLRTGLPLQPGSLWAEMHVHVCCAGAAAHLGRLPGGGRPAGPAEGGALYLPCLCIRCHAFAPSHRAITHAEHQRYQDVHFYNMRLQCGSHHEIFHTRMEVFPIIS